VLIYSDMGIEVKQQEHNLFDGSLTRLPIAILFFSFFFLIYIGNNKTAIFSMIRGPN